MNVELLELLELDDLQGEARELAECIGMEAFRRLLERYGGTGKMYIPQPDKVVIPVRDVLTVSYTHLTSAWRRTL